MNARGERNARTVWPRTGHGWVILISGLHTPLGPVHDYFGSRTGQYSTLTILGPIVARPIFFSLFFPLLFSLSHSGSPWFLSSLRFLLPLLPSFSLATFPPEGERGKKPITLDINSAGQSFVGDLLSRRKEGRKHISINVPLRTQHNSGNVRGKVTVVWGGGQQGVAVFRDEKGVEANWTNKVPEGSLRPISR